MISLFCYVFFVLLLTLFRFLCGCLSCDTGLLFTRFIFSCMSHREDFLRLLFLWINLCNFLCNFFSFQSNPQFVYSFLSCSRFEINVVAKNKFWGSTPHGIRCLTSANAHQLLIQFSPMSYFPYPHVFII